MCQFILYNYSTDAQDHSQQLIRRSQTLLRNNASCVKEKPDLKLQHFIQFNLPKLVKEIKKSKMEANKQV